MTHPPAPLAVRPLGRTGLHVPALCIGCAPLGDMPDTFAPVSEAQALEALRAVFAGPIGFLDTAAAYGDGESERRIGLALAEIGGLPPGFVLATKADRNLATDDFSGDQARRSVERSLRLLGVDQLQIVHLHDPEYARQSFAEMMAPGGAVAALLQLKDAGVIGALGIAAGPIDMMMRYVETGAFALALTHNRFTLLDRSAEPLLDLAAARGVALLNAAPYGGGLLAKGPDAWPKYMYRAASPAQIDRARRIEAACRRYGVPLAAAALQHSLRDPRVASTVVGISRAERVAQMAALAATPIPEALWGELAAI